MDGDNKIGCGHWRRMSALAQAFLTRGVESVFFSRRAVGKTFPFAVRTIPRTISFEEELGWLKEQVNQTGCQMLVIDSYAYGQAELAEVGAWPIYSVYCDDLNRHPFFVDCVVNGSLYGERLDYKGTALFLLGPEYALLRPAFARLAPPHSPAKARDILITLGGADVKNATPLILRWLEGAENLGDYHYHVAVGPAFSNKDVIAEQAKPHRNIALYSPADMVALIRKCDLAISAAGQTVHELTAAGVPALLLEVADNQHGNATTASELGLAVNLGPFDAIKKEVFLDAFIALSNNRTARRRMSEKGRLLIDGRGAKRLAKRLLAEWERKNG